MNLADSDRTVGDAVIIVTLHREERMGDAPGGDAKPPRALVDTQEDGMTSTGDALHERLVTAPTIGAVGLGYVGLPLAVAFARSGAAVIGIDVDAARVAGIARGQSFVEDVPWATLAELVQTSQLSVSDDFSVPRWGVVGAPLGLMAGFVVQLAGSALVLRRALTRSEGVREEWQP